MCDIEEQVHALGAEVVIIGSGQAWQAAAFRDERRVPYPMFVDPTLRAYRAAELKRGMTTVFNPRAAKHALRAFRLGHRQGATQGDPMQQGGVFVITPTGEVAWAQISTEAGDHADPAAILAALRALPPR